MPAIRQMANRNGIKRVLLFSCYLFIGVKIYNFNIGSFQQVQPVFQTVFFCIYHSFDAGLNNQFAHSIQGEAVTYMVAPSLLLLERAILVMALASA